MRLRSALLPTLLAACSSATEPVDAPDERPEHPAPPEPVVEVRVDAHGVSHLSCETDADCFAALGYVHAKHRFESMDLARRTYRGKLATLLGGSAIDSDRYVRNYLSTPSGEPLEEAVWAKLSGPTKALFIAYSAGVNEWLRDQPSIPFWDPLDSVALTIGVQQTNGDVSRDLDLAGQAQKLPADLFADLSLPIPPLSSWIRPAASLRARTPGEAEISTVPIIRASEIDFGALSTRARAAFGRSRSEDTLPSGSNNWAVPGAMTKNGAAIVANDPHGTLRIANSFPVEVDSVTRGRGSVHAFLVSVPGAPIGYIGHNAKVAWSCTVSMADATDYYVEQLSPDGRSVTFRSAEVPIVEREHVFESAGGAPAIATLRWVPHHGPLVYEDRERRLAVSARWVGHSAPLDIEAYLDLMRASDVEDARRALSRAESTGCNVVLGDSGGRVAWKVAVKVPSRPWASPELAPWLPLPGDGRAEWQGFVEERWLTAMESVPGGMIATANNDFDDGWTDGDPTNDGRPYLQDSPASGYRHQRIVERLRDTIGRHTAQDSIDLQADTMLTNARAMVPAILALTSTSPFSPRGTRAREALSAWRFRCPSGLAGTEPTSPKSADPELARESIGCSVFHVLLFGLGKLVLEDEYLTFGVANGFTLNYADRVLYRALVSPGTLRSGAAIWDDLRTAERESKTEMLRRGLEGAGVFLESIRGPDPDEWRWGTLHVVRFRSPSEPEDPGLGPFASDGGYVSVDPSGMTWDATARRFEQVAGAHLRMVVELGPEGPRTHFQLAGTLDPNPRSRWYRTWLENYLTNRPVEIRFGPANEPPAETYSFRPPPAQRATRPRSSGPRRSATARCPWPSACCPGSSPRGHRRAPPLPPPR